MLHKAMPCIEALGGGVALVHVEHDGLHAAGAQVVHNGAQQCAGKALAALGGQRTEVADCAYACLPIHHMGAAGGQQRAFRPFNAVENTIRDLLDVKCIRRKVAALGKERFEAGCVGGGSGDGPTAPHPRPLCVACGEGRTTAPLFSPLRMERGRG